MDSNINQNLYGICSEPAFLVVDYISKGTDLGVEAITHSVENRKIIVIDNQQSSILTEIKNNLDCDYILINESKLNTLPIVNTNITDTKFETIIKNNEHKRKLKPHERPYKFHR